MDLSTQTRQNLKVLRLVEVLPFFDLGCVCSPLLLCLSGRNPLLHCQMLVQLCKIVLSMAQTIEDRTLDRIQDDVVVRSVYR